MLTDTKYIKRAVPEFVYLNVSYFKPIYSNINRLSEKSNYNNVFLLVLTKKCKLSYDY